jgi:DNA (cytosine-5)-methyltransferase 1
MELSFVDLFCGAGGFTEGFLLAGAGDERFRLLAATDNNEMVAATYRHRFEEQLGIDFRYLCTDIRNRQVVRWLKDVSDGATRGVDVVCGGPPCQGFALFGGRNEADPRNDLFVPYVKIIDEIAPKYFVMENVPGLAMMYRGKTVEAIYDRVERMNVRYSLAGPLTVNAADYGVPQLRERILFIGSRDDCKPVKNIPPLLAPDEYVSVTNAIGDLAFLRPWESSREYSPAFPANTSYQRDSRAGRLFTKLGRTGDDMQLNNHEAACHTPDVIARFSLIRPGEGLESIPPALFRKHLMTSKKWCVRMDGNRPSNTVVTLPDDFVHPTQPRIPTVRELARLQSFDDTFRFLGPRSTGGGGAGNRMRSVQVPQYSQVGNAVPPLMAKAIAEVLLDALLA